MMPGNFHIINLGCKVNRVEADSMAADLLAAGAKQSQLADADVVLINTCTVTGEADHKSRKALHRALRKAAAATVIVCGCGASTDPGQFKLDNGEGKGALKKKHDYSEDNQSESNCSEKTTTAGSASKNDALKQDCPERDTPAGKRLKDSAPKGNCPEGSALECSALLGNCPEGNATEGSVPEHDVPKKNAPGDDALEYNASTDDALKADAPGGGARLVIIADKGQVLREAGKILGLDVLREQGSTARVGEGYRTRVAVKIQDGCDNACSYCIVPIARGPVQSVPLDQAQREIAAHVRAGAREIVLTGIDLGNYRDGTRRLVHLLDSIMAQEDTCRFRLSSIEPQGVCDDLIQLLAAFPERICAHLHIPLQSGSNAVLTAMNRPYDKDAYTGRIHEVKKALPHIALNTDVIVGFPGETEEDFRETLAVCEEVGFSRIHVFRYSSRPGTKAADLPGHLKAEDLAERADTLRRLAERLMKEDAERRIGSTELVLAEDSYKGRSESYYPVRISEGIERGSLVAMRITGIESGELIAETC